MIIKKHIVFDIETIIKKTVDLLKRVDTNIHILVNKIKHDYNDNKFVERLSKNIKHTRLTETLPNSKYTAYSENKGEKIAFCMNKNKKSDTIIDYNTLMFVALHEITHVGTESVGHDDTFWNNFKFILKEAVKHNIYKPVDYGKTPEEYCGMKLTDNPYFDL